MIDIAISLLVVATLAVLALFTCRAAVRRDRRKLEDLARRYGVTPTLGMTDADLESAINRRFSGWVSR